MERMQCVTQHSKVQCSASTDTDTSLTHGKYHPFPPHPSEFSSPSTHTRTHAAFWITEFSTATCAQECRIAAWGFRLFDESMEGFQNDDLVCADGTLCHEVVAVSCCMFVCRGVCFVLMKAVVNIWTEGGWMDGTIGRNAVRTGVIFNKVLKS